MNTRCVGFSSFKNLIRYVLYKKIVLLNDTTRAIKIKRKPQGTKRETMSKKGKCHDDKKYLKSKKAYKTYSTYTLFFCWGFCVCALVTHRLFGYKVEPIKQNTVWVDTHTHHHHNHATCSTIFLSITHIGHLSRVRCRPSYIFCVTQNIYRNG